MRSAPRPAAPSARRSGRLALGAGLLVIALPLAACGSDEDTPSSAPTVSATTAPSSTPSAAPSAEPSPSTTPDDAQVISVTVAGGAVSGVQPRTEVPLGSKVRLTVTSDAVDEIHVHGYDLTTALTAGQAAQLEFVADRPGIFEIELHDAGTVLTRLQVQ